MADLNPYAAPQSNLGGPASGGRQYPNIELIASGQKLVIYAIVVNLVGMGARGAAPLLITLVGVGALVVSCVGVYRLATGLEFGSGARVLCMLSMVIPIANLVVLLVLNSKATRALRDAGYTVGLLGASKAK